MAPSVVQVLAYGFSASPSALLARASSSGAGVIVDAGGWIVTNAHVVESARSVRVDIQPAPAAGGSILKPRSRRLAARVVGLDRETDVAVLKVEQVGLPALEFGDSEALHQGQIVLAFGSPLGLENSASLGVVSAVARQLKADDAMIYVQTDASINPGTHRRAPRRRGGPHGRTGCSCCVQSNIVDKGVTAKAGQYATVLFAIGLFGASLLAAFVLPLTAAYAVTEAFGLERGIDRTWSEAPVFVGIYTFVIVFGAVLVLIPNAPLITIMVMSQAVNGVLLPFLLIFMMIIVNDSRIMGRHTNGRAYNAIGWTTVTVVIGLTVALLGFMAVGAA